MVTVLIFKLLATKIMSVRQKSISNQPTSVISLRAEKSEGSVSLAQRQYTAKTVLSLVKKIVQISAL